MFCCLDNKVFLSHLKSKTPILSIEIKKISEFYKQLIHHTKLDTFSDIKIA